MRSLKIIPLLFIITLAFTACFSPYKGEEGNLIIQLGAAKPAARALPGVPTLNEFTHTVTLSGGPGRARSQSGVKLGDTVSFYVPPGKWNIEVKAWLGGVLRGVDDLETSVEITSGRNDPVPVTMRAYEPGLYQKNTSGGYTSPWNEPLETDLATAVSLVNDSSGGDFVYLADTGTSPGTSLDTPGVTLTLQSHEMSDTLTLSGQGAMFTVGGGTGLILDHVTLQGPPANNNSALVSVTGTLTMKDGSVIKDNNHEVLAVPPHYGGGVYVAGNGTFYMEGGLISGNSAVNWGGGVYAVEGGTFRKTGGTISGTNTALAGPVAYIDGAAPKARLTTAGPETDLDSAERGGWNDIRKVTFVSNNGGADTVISGLISGDTISEPAKPVKTAYDSFFEGWDIADNGPDGIANTADDARRRWDFASDTIPESDITLYAKWRPYEIGEAGPGGGKIFYRAAGGFTVTDYGTAWYLEAAPADVQLGGFWGSHFGLYEPSPPATFRDIGRGRKNTATLISEADREFENPRLAAHNCRDYRGGEKTDWFLPSYNELYELYSQKSIFNNWATRYVSSCRYNDSSGLSAWHLTFDDGDSYEAGFAHSGSVRPIRAF